MGWNPSGIEPIKILSEYGKNKFGLNILNGVFHDFNIPKNHFDIVSLLDVIEHVENPKNFLINIRSIIKNNGLLIISFPDIGSISAKLFKKNGGCFVKDILITLILIIYQCY